MRGVVATGFHWRRAVLMVLSSVGMLALSSIRILLLPHVLSGPLLMAGLLCLARIVPSRVILAGVMALVPFTALPGGMWYQLRLSLADLAMVVVFLNWLWSGAREVEPHGPQVSSRPDWLLLAFPSTALISTGIAALNHAFPPSSPVEILKIIVLYAYAIAANRAALIQAPRSTVFLPWIIAAAIQAILAATAVTLIPFGYRLPFLYAKRGCGTMVDPNALAGYLNCSLFLALGLAAGLKRTAKVWITVASIVCGIGLVAAASVGAFLGFAAGIVTLILLTRGEGRLRSPLFALLLALIVLGGLAALSMPTNLFNLAVARFGFPDDDLTHRLRLWAKAVQLILAHPLFGVGRGGFVLAPAPGDPNLVGIPHNTYLGIAAELGLVGLAVFLALSVRSLRLLLAWDGDESRPLRYGLAAAFIALLVQGLVINIENARALWLIVGMALSLHPVSSEGRRQTGMFERWRLLFSNRGRAG